MDKMEVEVAQSLVKLAKSLTVSGNRVAARGAPGANVELRMAVNKYGVKPIVQELANVCLDMADKASEGDEISPKMSAYVEDMEDASKVLSQAARKIKQ